ncbi:hypothetical protein G7Y89_g12339 [Cudoniella acicularis]|uniref:Uncharacterized protein n=1 Tax=Cudoniella acicularis TaxID=354080 RepID=A0A8H4RBQ4_9HELO|nr:hypothetical protein G7Y89_g12339 [Cudoniella acicularis]
MSGSHKSKRQKEHRRRQPRQNQEPPQVPLLGAPAFVQPPPEPFVPPYNGNLRLLDHRLISVPGYTMLVHRREGPLGSQNNSPSHTPLPPQNYPAPQDDPIPPQQANFEINITINVQTIIHTNAQTDEESSTESPSPEIESGMDEEGIPGSWSPNPMDWNQSIGATGHSSDDTDPNTSSNDSRPTSEEGDGVRPTIQGLPQCKDCPRKMIRLETTPTSRRKFAWRGHENDFGLAKTKRFARRHEEASTIHVETMEYLYQNHLHQADNHDQHPEYHAYNSSANKLENSAQITGDERERHGANDERGREDEMQVHVEGFVGEPVIEHDFAADEGFEGEGGEHVEAEAEAGDVHHGAVCGEVVEDVSLGEGAEG